jgi:hypothetical protein
MARLFLRAQIRAQTVTETYKLTLNSLRRFFHVRVRITPGAHKVEFFAVASLSRLDTRGHSRGNVYRHRDRRVACARRQ